MEFPGNLRYTATHEWFYEDAGCIVIGLTDYAQSEMGDLVFIDLPQEGDEVDAGEAFADAESVKAVSEVISPVSGTVVAVNEELLDDPALVNSDPYGAWLIRVEAQGDTVEALGVDAYRRLCSEEE